MNEGCVGFGGWIWKGIEEEDIIYGDYGSPKDPTTDPKDDPNNGPSIDPTIDPFEED